MKKLKKVFIFLLILITYAACSDKKSNPAGEESLDFPKTNPLRGNTAAIDEGLKLFAIKCSQCHGPAAAGGPEAPDLTDKETRYGSSEEDIFTVIYHGTSNGMPTWGKDLGEENIWKVIAYITNIKKN